MAFVTNPLRTLFEAIPLETSHNSIFNLIDEAAGGDDAAVANKGLHKRPRTATAEPEAKATRQTGDPLKDAAARVADQMPVANLIAVMIDENSNTSARLAAGDDLRELMVNECKKHPAPTRNPTGAPTPPRIDDAADALRVYADKVRKEVLEPALPPLALYAITRCAKGVTTQSILARTGFSLALAAVLSVPHVAAAVRPEVFINYLAATVMSYSTNSSDRKAFRQTATLVLAAAAIAIACPPASDASGRNLAAADRGVRAMRAACLVVPVGSSVSPAAIPFVAGLAAATARLAKLHRAVVSETVAVELLHAATKAVCAPHAFYRGPRTAEHTKTKDGKGNDKGTEKAPFDKNAYSFVLIAGAATYAALVASADIAVTVVDGIAELAVVGDAKSKKDADAKSKKDADSKSKKGSALAPFLTTSAAWGDVFCAGTQAVHPGSRSDAAPAPFGVRALISASATCAPSTESFVAVVTVLAKGLNTTIVPPKALAAALVSGAFTPAADAAPFTVGGWDVRTERLAAVSRMTAERDVGALGPAFASAIRKAASAAARVSAADRARTVSADVFDTKTKPDAKADDKEAAAKDAKAKPDAARAEIGKDVAVAIRRELVTPVADSSHLAAIKQTIADFYSALGLAHVAAGGLTAAAHDRSGRAVGLFNSIRRALTRLRELATKATAAGAVAATAAVLDFALTHVLLAAPAPADVHGGGTATAMHVVSDNEWYGPASASPSLVSLHALPSALRRTLADVVVTCVLTPTTSGAKLPAAQQRRSPTVLPLRTVVARIAAIVAAAQPLVKSGKAFVVGASGLVDRSVAAIDAARAACDAAEASADLAVQHALLDSDSSVASALAMLTDASGTLGYDARASLQPFGAMGRCVGTLQSASAAVLLAAIFGCSVANVGDLAATAADLAGIAAQIASCYPTLLVARVDAAKLSKAATKDLPAVREAAEEAVTRAVGILLERSYGNQLLLPSLRGRIETLALVALRGLMQCDLLSPAHMLDVCALLRRPTEHLRQAIGDDGDDVDEDEAGSEGGSDSGSGSGSGSSSGSSSSDDEDDDDDDEEEAGSGNDEPAGGEFTSFFAGNAPSEIDVEDIPDDVGDDDAVSVDGDAPAAKRNTAADDVAAQSVALRQRMLTVVSDYLEHQGALRPSALLTPAKVGDLVSLSVSADVAGDVEMMPVAKGGKGKDSKEKARADSKKADAKDAKGKDGKGKASKETSSKEDAKADAKAAKAAKLSKLADDHADDFVGIVWRAPAVAVDIATALLLSVRRLATKSENKFVPVKGDVLSKTRRKTLGPYLAKACAVAKQIKVLSAVVECAGKVDEHPSDAQLRYAWGLAEADGAVRAAVRMFLDFSDRRLLVDETIAKQYREALMHTAVVLADAGVSVGYALRARNSTAAADEWLKVTVESVNKRITEIVVGQRCAFAGTAPLAQYRTSHPREFALLYAGGVFGAVAKTVRPRAAKKDDDDSDDDAPAKPLPGGVIRALALGSVEAKRVLSVAKALVAPASLEKLVTAPASGAFGKATEPARLLAGIEAAAFEVVARLPAKVDSVYKEAVRDAAAAVLKSEEADKAQLKAETAVNEGVERATALLSWAAATGGRAAALAKGGDAAKESYVIPKNAGEVVAGFLEFYVKHDDLAHGSAKTYIHLLSRVVGGIADAAVRMRAEAAVAAIEAAATQRKDERKAEKDAKPKKEKKKDVHAKGTAGAQLSKKDRKRAAKAAAAAKGDAPKKHQAKPSVGKKADAKKADAKDAKGKDKTKYNNAKDAKAKDTKAKGKDAKGKDAKGKDKKGAKDAKPQFKSKLTREQKIDKKQRQQASKQARAAKKKAKLSAKRK